LARKHGFWDFKIDGVMFVNQLISYLKVKEKEALNVLKGVNAVNLNRKIKHAVTMASIPQDLDMTSFVKDKLLGGFKVRLTSKSQDHQYYNFGHPYITGRGATKKIVKSSRHRTNSITYAGMMSVLMYGRKKYDIPNPNTKRNSRMPMMWKNKPHYASKSGFAGGFVGGKKVLHIKPYAHPIDYTLSAAAEVEAWMTQIQDKFLSKGFTKV
jgi:hypothetical protein